MPGHGPIKHPQERYEYYNVCTTLRRNMIKATYCLAFLASLPSPGIQSFTVPRASCVPFQTTKLSETKDVDSEKDVMDIVSISPFQTGVPDDKVALIPYRMKNGKTVFVPDAVWMTGAPQFWAQDMYGEGVTVGVIDSGIDHTHPSLDGRVNPTESRNYCTWDKAASTDFGSHGTHVAGSIAANSRSGAQVDLVGVAPKAKLRDYRVFDQWGFPIRLKDPAAFVERRRRNPKLRLSINDVYFPIEEASIAQAIRDAVADGCDVINMSLGGGPPDRETQEAIQEARSKGVAVIAAAGNKGAGQRSYPAAYEETLSVAAVNVKLPEGRVEKVWFSNDDSEVDVAADGYFLFSTYPRGEYQAISGTSMATPCVAGMAALLRESMLKRNRNDGKDGMPDIHDLLRHRAISVFDGDGKERNEVAGHGLCTFFSEVPAVKDGQWFFPELDDNEPRFLN